jgi:hypothetical protein
VTVACSDRLDQADGCPKGQNALDDTLWCRLGTRRAELERHRGRRGLEPSLQARTISLGSSSAIRGLRAETLICGILACLAMSDRESPLGLARSGT